MQFLKPLARHVDTIGINPNLCARDRSNMARWNVGNVIRENVTAAQPIFFRLFFLTDGRDFFVDRHNFTFLRSTIRADITNPLDFRIITIDINRNADNGIAFRTANVIIHSNDPKQIAFDELNQFANNSLIQGLFKIEQAFTITIILDKSKA